MEADREKETTLNETFLTQNAITIGIEKCLHFGRHLPRTNLTSKKTLTTIVHFLFLVHVNIFLH